MSLFTTPKATDTLTAELIRAYLKNGGKIKTRRTPKAKVKTFLNHSYRGAKAYTLRNAGYAKATS